MRKTVLGAFLVTLLAALIGVSSATDSTATFIRIDGAPAGSYVKADGSGWGIPSGTPGVASINATTGAFTFTGTGVSCTGTTCTFGGSSPITPATITVSAFSANPNTCYNLTGGASWTQSTGTPTPTTTTMTGLTTSMAPHWAATSDISQVVGWGAINGMILNVRASAANTLSSYVCNVTASTISQGGFSAQVEP
jgi:hypothetical protein